METLIKARPARFWMLLVALFAVFGTVSIGCYPDTVGVSGSFSVPVYAPGNYGAYTYYGYYPAPRPGMTWIEGRWVWGGNNWGWRGGYWAQSRPGYTWQRGRYSPNGRGGWHYQPGTWRRHW
jgi:hypothetical protein